MLAKIMWIDTTQYLIAGWIYIYIYNNYFPLFSTDFWILVRRKEAPAFMIFYVISLVVAWRQQVTTCLLTTNRHRIGFALYQSRLIFFCSIIAPALPRLLCAPRHNIVLHKSIREKNRFSDTFRELSVERRQSYFLTFPSNFHACFHIHIFLSTELV